VAIATPFSVLHVLHRFKARQRWSGCVLWTPSARGWAWLGVSCLILYKARWEPGELLTVSAVTTISRIGSRPSHEWQCLARNVA
jgi:hypothetical protein